jgi:hypothetical protein
MSGQTAGLGGLRIDRPRLSSWRLLATFSLAVVCGTVVLLRLGGASPSPYLASDQPRSAGAQTAGRTQALPAALVPVASARIGSSERVYRPSRSGAALVADGGGIRSRFGASGVALTVARAKLGLSLAGVRQGQRAEPVGSVLPAVLAGGEVLYRQPTLNEWYRNGPYGLEQGFTVFRGPAGAGGALVLTLRTTGTLSARRSGSQVLFSSSAGTTVLRYGELSAQDASGRSLPVSLRVSGRTIQLRIDDRGARYPLRIDPFIQQGAKIVDVTMDGAAAFGDSVALSADGNTALIGGYGDADDNGAAWVFIRTGSTWSQQTKFVDAGPDSGAHFGRSVALSADGNTALIGGPDDSGSVGAAWVFTRTGPNWAQQAKLVDTGPDAGANFGTSVSLSGNGQIALIGGPADSSNKGAAWIFTVSGTTWTQQAKLVDTGADAGAAFGDSVALSADGGTALIGGPIDGGDNGAAWIFTGSGSSWTQQAKITSPDTLSEFGEAVALSANGGTALIGAFDDDTDVGAAWVFAGSGASWNEQAKLVDSQDAIGEYGYTLALSADGKTALVGGLGVSAAWLFTDSGGSWAQQQELVPNLPSSDTLGSNPQYSSALALSADGNTALVGAPIDSDGSPASEDGSVFWYATARASSPSALTFGLQTVGQAGPVLWLPVVNAGPLDLTFTGAASIAGPNATDFAIPAGDEQCDGATLDPGAECWIGVRFTASSAAGESATLTLGSSNTLDASPATIALSGTGVAANSGPAGPAGAAGAPGSAGEIELVTCKSVKKKVKGKEKTVQKCTTQLTSSPMSFTATTASASVSRAGRVYATGSLADGKLRLHATRQLRPGHYTLRLTTGSGETKHTTRQSLTVGETITIG